jgi:H+/Cl- antiporter ClcA
MTASFGSPLGGVLFSIEVTAKYYEIKCLWEGIICSSVCILVFNIITFAKSEVLFERTNFTGFDMDEEMLAFVLLGVITGVRTLLASLSRSKRMRYGQSAGRSEQVCTARWQFCCDACKADCSRGFT